MSRCTKRLDQCTDCHMAQLVTAGIDHHVPRPVDEGLTLRVVFVLIVTTLYSHSQRATTASLPQSPRYTRGCVGYVCRCGFHRSPTTFVANNLGPVAPSLLTPTPLGVSSPLT